MSEEDDSIDLTAQEHGFSELSSSSTIEVADLPTRRKDQERLLISCSTRFHDLLNLEELFPHLVQEGLLTWREVERLQSRSSSLSGDGPKIDHLLKILPKKGKNSLRRFLRCLQRTEAGTAHDELARYMVEVATHGADYASHDKSDGPKTGIIVLS